MAGGPTIGAGEAAPNVWGTRPALALFARVCTVLVPFASALAVAFVVGPSLPHPHGPWGTGLWILQISVLSTAAVLVVDRLARRTLPLASLYNMSLVFPDEAPSRFRTALKAGSVNRLRDALASRPDDESTNDAAARLLTMVAALNGHDRLTRGHTERVRAYRDLIAEQMNLSAEDRWKLRWAVLLHDIGKLTVPPEILNKEGRPTDEEWEVLSGHPAAGAIMVEPLAEWLGEWRLAAGQHHERWDGQGYPNGLAGEEICLAGRIAAVADAYDVITSARSYKKPMSAVVARQEMDRCAGSQFDPQVVRALVNVSLGRLRLAGGPLAWLASLPRLGSLPAVAAGALGNVALVVSAAAVVLAVGVASPSHRSAEPQGSRSVAVGHHHDSSSSSGDSGGSRSRGGSPSGAGTTDNPGDSDGSSSSGTTSTTTVGAGGVTTTAPGSDRSTITATTPTTGGAGSGSPARGSATPTATTPGATPVPGTTTSSNGSALSTSTTLRPTTTTSVPVGPSAVGDALSAQSGVQVALPVLANDSAGSRPLDMSSLVILSPPANAVGAAVAGDGTIDYRSIPGFTGVDSLRYGICDTDGLCADAVVTITVS